MLSLLISLPGPSKVLVDPQTLDEIRLYDIIAFKYGEESP